MPAVLPQVKVPGRRGRKPSEFVPENDEVAALNAVERAEMKVASKLRERKAKGLAGMLGGDSGFSEAELEKRRQQIKNLINIAPEKKETRYPAQMTLEELKEVLNKSREDFKHGRYMTTEELRKRHPLCE